MKSLQQIIEEMKSDIQDEERLYTWRSCLEYYVPKLELLLNEQPKVITDDSHFCKHDVQQSAASEETSDKVNIPSESSSETQIVQQNEQTNEVWLQCGWAYQPTVGNYYCCSCYQVSSSKPIGCARRNDK